MYEAVCFQIEAKLKQAIIALQAKDSDNAEYDIREALEMLQCEYIYPHRECVSPNQMRLV